MSKWVNFVLWPFVFLIFVFPDGHGHATRNFDKLTGRFFLAGNFKNF